MTGPMTGPVTGLMTRAGDRAASRGRALRLGLRAGERPDRLPRALIAMHPYGQGMLGGVAAACARYPHAVALRTPQQTLTFGDLWQRSGRLAQALKGAGVAPTDRIGLLARNDAFFVVGMLAAARLGADVVLMNTALAPPQMAEVAQAEHLSVLLHDRSLSEAAQACAGTALWSESRCESAAADQQRQVGPPTRTGEMIVLTSGTTGRPRGARRPTGGRRASSSASEFAAALPWRVRSTVAIPAPFFHAWGLAGLMISLALSCTVMTRPSFDAESTLRDLDEHDVDLLIAVPVMLQRMVELPGSAWVAHDLSRLRGVVSSGSALPAATARDLLRRVGPVVYNVYGSTEVAASTIARPADLLRDPTTAGRPAPGVRVEVLDESGRPVTGGATGQVHVGSTMAFRGYTVADDDSKAPVRGLVPTGDLGHWDRHGCLTIDGRSDDMVVSGGENVYPIEVEELLASHPDVLEVAVAGRPDREFGEALVAWVVPRPGTTPTTDELRDFVRERLASFKVPRRVELLPELPRTATGKVLRRELT